MTRISSVPYVTFLGVAMMTDVKKYEIGDLTMEKVFRPKNIVNLSDLQAVFDQVENALYTLKVERDEQAEKLALDESKQEHLQQVFLRKLDDILKKFD